jgi:hypothetical protein
MVVIKTDKLLTMLSSEPEKPSMVLYSKKITQNAKSSRKEIET